MRAVIIGTDFIRDSDGSFKALETNTNISLNTQWVLNFNSASFESFIQDNNFTEIVLIAAEANLIVKSDFSENLDVIELKSFEPQIDVSKTFKDYIENFCSGSATQITFSHIKTNIDSITIPFVEDTNDKLIIRLAFDTTALIDDTYAKDNWEFLKLMYDADSTSIPKCYINDDELGIDNIGVTLRNNGNHPNYCVKKRITPSENKIYPILYKIDTLEQLEQIKSNLEVDEYIQEFIYNTDDLLENKIKSYRSIDLIYGPNLNILQLQSIVTTALLPIVDNCDFNDDNKVQFWDRNRYLQKFHNLTQEIGLKFSASEDTNVFLNDNTLKNVKDLEINDEVKSINFLDLPSDYSGSELTWSSSFTSVINNYEISSSILKGETSDQFFGLIVEFTTDTNAIFSDVNHALILVKNNDDVKFKSYMDLEVNNTIILFDSQSNSLITSNIVSIRYNYQKLNAYILDFEQFDLFLTAEETPNQQRYGLITHNLDYNCRYVRCYGNPYQSARLCGDGSVWGGGYYGFGWNCVRVNASYYLSGYGSCQYSNEASSWDGAQYSSFCNDQKSDISYKENLILIGKSNNGLNIYQFNYKGEDGLYEGVIAQELIGTEFEAALSKNEDNLYVIDYNKIDVEFKKIK